MLEPVLPGTCPWTDPLPFAGPARRVREALLQGDRQCWLSAPCPVFGIQPHPGGQLPSNNTGSGGDVLNAPFNSTAICAKHIARRSRLGIRSWIRQLAGRFTGSHGFGVCSAGKRGTRTRPVGTSLTRAALHAGWGQALTWAFARARALSGFVPGCGRHHTWPMDTSSGPSAQHRRRSDQALKSLSESDQTPEILMGRSDHGKSPTLHKRT